MTSPQPLSRAAQRAPAQPRGQHLRLWRALLAGSVWVGTAFSVIPHLIDGAGQRFTGLSDVLGGLGVVAGLVAMNSMLFMLLLAARVPVIDRALGRVRAIRWYRLLGRVTVLGMLTHVALILTGTGLTNRDDLPGAVGSPWTGDLPLAIALAALLLLTTIASVFAVCRGLRREVRHLLNILSYAAALLAIPHMLRFDPVFLSSRAQRIYWGVLLVSVGACLLWYRILSPLLRSWRHRLKLVNTLHLTPDLLHLEFSGRHLDKLEPRGGQYFTWRLLTPQLWTRTHRFFLSAAPTRDRLRITVRVTDEHTAELAAARPGTRVIFAGPYGAFTDASRTRDGRNRSRTDPVAAGGHHRAPGGHRRDPPRIRPRGAVPPRRVPAAVRRSRHRPAPDDRPAPRGPLGEHRIRRPRPVHAGTGPGELRRVRLWPGRVRRFRPGRGPRPGGRPRAVPRGEVRPVILRLHRGRGIRFPGAGDRRP